MKRALLACAATLLAAICVQCTHVGPPAPAAEAPRGDAMRGYALVQKMECGRCHVVAVRSDLEHEPIPREKQCSGCHAEILRGTVDGTPAQLARWRGRVADLADVPSLTRTGRFKRSWIESFLRHPRDLRPGLRPTMPRLPLSDEDARDLATFLAPLDEDDGVVLRGASAARGRELMEAKGCAACHVMTGVPPLRAATLPTDVAVPDMPRARRLAPDLRFARDRLRTRALVAWLRDPTLEKPDTRASS
jgi:cytochrome c551/c552